MRHRLSLLIGVAFVAVACAPAGPSRSANGAEESVPAAPMAALDGTSTDLGTVVRGHPALVSLWATWCDACVGETKALNQLEERSRSVVAVAVGETRQTVGAFAEHHGIAYPVFVDENFRVADALGERRVPATLVVDRRGRIVFRGGALDHAGLEALRQVLAEK